jgi:disulfide bond formation protein DsbB
MTVASVLSLFAWGVLFINALMLGLVALAVISYRRKTRAVNRVRSIAGPLSIVVTVVATLGSLYLSEIGDLSPCRWCWIQRVFMYPLAVVLVIAWLTRDRHVRRYAVPLSLMGVAASIWHYLLQQVPSLSDAKSCSLTTPCSVTYIEKFGFISIPWMAGSVFVLVLMLLIGFRSREGRIG